MISRYMRVFLFILATAGVCGLRAVAQDYPTFPGDFREYDFTRVIGIQGGAALVRGGQSAPLKKGVDLGVGDIIKVAPNGVVVINYLTDNYLVLWPSSSIQIKYSGRTGRGEKSFYYAQAAGKVYNKIGGSYFGASDVRVEMNGGEVQTGAAEFCTTVFGGAIYAAVRNGDVDFIVGGAKRPLAAGKMMTVSGGAVSSNAPIADDQRSEFLTAAQYIVMAKRGEELHNPAMTISAPLTESEIKPYISGKDQPMVYQPAYTNNEAQAGAFGEPEIQGQVITDQPRKNKQLTTSDRVMGGELPYFPPDRLGEARNPDKDYSKDAPPPIVDSVVPGDVTDSELWPELFPETDAEMREPGPNYPFPENNAKPKPTPYRREKGESLRSVQPPPVYAVTQRSNKDAKADYKGAYDMCQNYNATQSEVDDCIAKHLKPEAVPGTVKFPDPPPELNLPMSHEPEAPMYVELPPVSEIPPPNGATSRPSLPQCKYSLLSDTSLMHNNEGIDQLNQGRYASALESFEDALRVNPESADILNNIGLTYLSMGVPEKGERYMKKSLAAEPGRIDIHNNLGCVYFSQGKSLQACSEWKLASEQDEKFKDAADNKTNFCR